MLKKLLLTLFILLTLSACTKLVPYYKPDIQQGNIITQIQVNKLNKGMSKQQVIAILGTPIVKNTFYTNQLIYINTNKPNKKPYTEKRLILYFTNGKLTSGTGDFKLKF